MKAGFRQSMAWLHSWAGLLVGWVLFFVFVTGTFGYVTSEIDHWMRPEEPLVTAPRPASELTPLALAHLQKSARDAQTWFVDFPGGRDRDFSVAWRAQPEGEEKFGKFTREQLDQSTGQLIEVKPRDTGGGGRLYRMHYALHYLPFDWAMRIVGACSMFMLVAIISGIITHKKIFLDFFTFRPARGQRSWLDGHGLLSVAGLPFHLMITYSGLVLYMWAYMPVGPDVIYGADKRDAFFQEAFGGEPDAEKPASAAALLAPIPPMVRMAELQWGKEQVSRFVVDDPGRSDAKVRVSRRSGSSLTGDGGQLQFDGVTGKQIVEPEEPPKVAYAVNGALNSLHRGFFAGPLVRLLYLLVGALGSAMVATGLVLWTAKRKAKLAKMGKTHFGVAVVDRLNLGAIIGLPVAIAAYFWANRLLPVGMEQRAGWEVHVMFMTWAVMFIYPIWRPLGRAWIELSWVAAAAYALIPFLNALTTDRHLGVSIPAGDWVLAGFDLSMLGIGFFFGWLARKLTKRAARPAPAPRRPRGSSLPIPQPAE